LYLKAVCLERTYLERISHALHPQYNQWQGYKDTTEARCGSVQEFHAVRAMHGIACCPPVDKRITQFLEHGNYSHHKKRDKQAPREQEASVEDHGTIDCMVGLVRGQLG
jgi:hypothetical protein